MSILFTPATIGSLEIKNRFVRSDRRGGSEDNRFRFLSEILTRVKREVGADFPVFIKLGMEDFVEGGLTLPESVSIGRRLDAFGIDAIETSGDFSGRVENIRKGILPHKREAYFRHYASVLKKNVNAPIIKAGKQ